MIEPALGLGFRADAVRSGAQSPNQRENPRSIPHHARLVGDRSRAPLYYARCDRLGKVLIRSKSTASGGETPKGSAVSGVNLGRSSVRKAPVGQEDRHERLAEPIPREVGL